MKASELRIGNWVNYDGLSVQVSGIRGDAVMIGGQSVWNKTADKYQPIALTPEILEQCGFVKYQWQNAYFIKFLSWHLYIHFFEGRIITHFCRVSSDSKGHRMISLPFIGAQKSTEEIKHLHDLQNFYYSHTKNELVYQPIKELT